MLYGNVWSWLQVTDCDVYWLSCACHHAKDFLCKLLVGHIMQMCGSKLSELTCGGYRMSGGVGLKAVIH